MKKRFDILKNDLCYHGATVTTSLSSLTGTIILKNGTVFEMPLYWEFGCLWYDAANEVILNTEVKK